MAHSPSIPTVFVGSSTEALPIVAQLAKGLADVADVRAWNSAFESGTWLLGSILRQAQQSDFGLFVLREDDKVKIEEREYSTVRDNVLFEAGVFMGALGPQRTILLWPSSEGAETMRLPSDLQGLLLEHYVAAHGEEAEANLKPAIESIVKRIQKMGFAVRSGYNEIASLKQSLDEREIVFEDDSVESLKKIIQRAANRRKRPWFSVTSVERLTHEIGRDYDESVVSDVFWWLIIYGVIAFDNVEHWNDGDWDDYESSVEYTQFTPRGLVLLNELRAEAGR
jgi:Predicted nucleotide-binding protein containing TIR-like domain